MHRYKCSIYHNQIQYFQNHIQQLTCTECIVVNEKNQSTVCCKLRTQNCLFDILNTNTNKAQKYRGKHTVSISFCKCQETNPMEYSFRSQATTHKVLNIKHIYQNKKQLKLKKVLTVEFAAVYLSLRILVFNIGFHPHNKLQETNYDIDLHRKRSSS